MGGEWRVGRVDDDAYAPDGSVKSTHQHGADGDRPGSEGRRAQRIEVITGQRRRSWSDDEKTAIIAESLGPGVNVSEVARRHGVSVGLLHYWRRRARTHSSDAGVQFIPVIASSEPAATSGALGGGSIQIDYGGARIRVTGAVDPKALAAVLSALQAQS